MDNNQDSNLLNDQIEDTAKIAGAKLAVYISSLNLDNEAEEALLLLVPSMSLGQMIELTRVLENKYLEGKMEKLDQEFKKDVEKIQDKYKKNIKKVDDKAMSDLEELEKSLPTS